MDSDTSVEEVEIVNKLNYEETLVFSYIIRKWDRKRIVKFCTHLLGDECQRCKWEDYKEN